MFVTFVKMHYLQVIAWLFIRGFIQRKRHLPVTFGKQYRIEAMNQSTKLIQKLKHRD